MKMEDASPLHLRDGFDFHSQNVKEINYAPDVSLLYVTYKRTGETYQYTKVDLATYIALTVAPSKQIFINLYIKDKFPCKKV